MTPEDRREQKMNFFILRNLVILADTGAVRSGDVAAKKKKIFFLRTKDGECGRAVSRTGQSRGRKARIKKKRDFKEIGEIG